MLLSVFPLSMSLDIVTCYSVAFHLFQNLIKSLQYKHIEELKNHSVPQSSLKSDFHKFAQY